MDMQNLTPEELAQLIADAQTEYAQRQADQVQAEADAKAAITASVAPIQEMVGTPEDAPYNPESTADPTLYSLLAHTDQVLADNAGLAFRLILQGMLIQSQAQIATAVVTGESL